MFQSICSASASVSVCPSPLKASAECAKRAPTIISCVHMLISVFTGKWWPLKLNYFHLVCAGDTLKIGDIAYKLKKPQNPELVPVKHSMWFCLFFCTNCNYVWNKKNKKSCNWFNKFFKYLFPFDLPVSESLPQAVVQHLRWIMQKDLLGQDVFLIGPPGPLRRSIAMQYLVSIFFKLLHTL